MVICTGVTAAATVMLNDFVAVCGVDEESLVWTVKEVVPDCVGVPLIWPVEAVRLSPVGKDPELIDHEYGATPPLAVRAALYAANVVAVGSAVEEICKRTVAVVEPEADPSTPIP